MSVCQFRSFWVIFIMPKIPEISVEIKMKSSVSVPSDWNFFFIVHFFFTIQLRKIHWLDYSQHRFYLHDIALVINFI